MRQGKLLRPVKSYALATISAGCKSLAFLYSLTDAFGSDLFSYMIHTKLLMNYKNFLNILPYSPNYST